MEERLSRVNHLLRKEISLLVAQEIEFLPGALLTVTRVETTPNFQQARVFVSVFPRELSNRALTMLSKNVFDLQQILNRRLKMRPVPRIEWVLETKTVEAQRIEELLEQVKQDI